LARSETTLAANLAAECVIVLMWGHILFVIKYLIELVLPLNYVGGEIISPFNYLYRWDDWEQGYSTITGPNEDFDFEHNI